MIYGLLFSENFATKMMVPLPREPTCQTLNITGIIWLIDRYLSDKIRTEERHRFHFFNTFFFQKLDALRRDSSRALEGRDAFQSVRKWTRNVNIFETDYIFIPVNFR